MRILRGLESLPDPALSGCVLTWGVFDGVHRGHRAVLRELVDWAAERRAPAVALTFDRHPAEVLRGVDVPLLCPLDGRLARIAETGVSATLVLSFTPAFASTPADAFVRDIVASRLGACAVLLGHDSHFGRGRAGDAETLVRLAGELGIEARTCLPERWRGRAISSSLIREEVFAGRLEEAGEMLGRPFSLHGIVVAGRGRGATLGVPTANLEVRHKVRPPRGVYAVLVALDGEEREGVANLGVRPTFESAEEESVEVHLLEYAGGPLYGRDLEVRFVARLRDERRFTGPEELIRQIRSDIAAARERIAAWRSSTPTS